MSSHSDDESQIDDDVNMEKHEKQQTKYEQTTNNDAFIHIRRWMAKLNTNLVSISRRVKAISNMRIESRIHWTSFNMKRKWNDLIWH